MRLRSLSLRLAEQKAADKKSDKSSPATADTSCEPRQKSSPIYYRADGADNQEEMKTSASTNCYYDDHEQIQVQQSGSTTDNMHGNYLYHEGDVGAYIRQQQQQQQQQQPSANAGSQACEQVDSRSIRGTTADGAYTGNDQEFVNNQGISDTYTGNHDGTEGLYYSESCRNVTYQDYMGMESAEEEVADSPTSTDHDQADASHSVERDIPKPINKKNLKRHRLSHSETRFLLNQFGQNPHPDAAQRVLLSKQINGLSVRQIQVWFQNRRAKLKRMSASDADRMLSTRSYPDGYGPQGFENRKNRQESPRESSPCLTKADASYTGQDHSEGHVLQPKDDSEASPQYLNSNTSSVFRRPHLRSPLIGQHSPAYTAQTRQSGLVRDGTNSPYPEATMSRGPASPQGSPAQYDGTAYGLSLRAPAVQGSARFIYGRPYASPHAVYAPRSVQMSAGYISSPEISPGVQNTYRSYPTADQRAYYTPSFLAPQNYENTGYRQAYNISEQVSSYHAPGQDGSYIMTNAQSRPLGYNQHVPSSLEKLYSDVRDTRGLQTSTSSPDDNYNQAPPMQREVKCMYTDVEAIKPDQEDYIDAPQYYGREQHDTADTRANELTYAAHLQPAPFHQRQACQQEYGSEEYLSESFQQRPGSETGND